MVAPKRSWDEAPADATHQHVQTQMFYKQVDDRMYVRGANNKWNNSKVVVGSPMLQPRPVTETKEPVEMEPLLIEAADKAELFAKLIALGLPEELVVQMVEAAEQVEVEDEEVCNCPHCSGEEMSRTEVGQKVGKLLARTLKEVKEKLDLDFDVQDIMRQIGFVKQDEPKRVAGDIDDAMFEKLVPVVSRIMDKTGMPAPVAVSGLKTVFEALDAEGLIKH